LNDFNKAIEVIASTDIPSAVGGSALRFRQVFPFGISDEFTPHSETLRYSVSISGDYIALASIYINIMRTVTPISNGFGRVYIRDETNTVVYELVLRTGAVGDRQVVTQFMPLVFNTTPANKSFRIFTSDASVGGAYFYSMFGFFAQI
jgi:hypothetical protein